MRPRKVQRALVFFLVTLVMTSLQWLSAGQEGDASPPRKPKIDEAHARLLERLGDARGKDAHRVVTTALDRLEADWPRSAPALEVGLRHQEPLVRAVCARVLAQASDDSESGRLVLEALGDRSHHVRLAAVSGLTESGRLLGEEELRALMVRVRVEPNAKVCKCVVVLLGRQGNDAVVPSLVERLEVESDDGVRRSLVSNLRRLTDRSHGDDLEAWRGVAEDILESERSREIIDHQKFGRRR